jgi:hypothetical protein
VYRKNIPSRRKSNFLSLLSQHYTSLLNLHNDDEKDDSWTQEEDDEEQETMEDECQEDGQEVGVLEMKELRDEIAEHMWSDYNMYFDSHRQ